ncbi:hypothetical protein F5X96DRAFT_635004 [Biscogniauxia mediterranea]|nr:hypothetical protein F5X96DRAFT_635004 [Biscogniauxia mediterranea]
MCCGSDEDYYHGGQQDSQYHGAQRRRRYDDEQAEKLARQREARIAAERYGWKNDRRPQQQQHGGGGGRSNGGKLPPIQTPGTRDSYLDPGLNSQVVNMPDYMPYAQAYDPRRPRQPNINNNNHNNSHRPGAGAAQQHLPQQYSQQYNAFKPHRRAPAPPVAAQAQAQAPPPYYQQQHHPHSRQQHQQQQQQRPAIVRQQPRRTQPMTTPTMAGGMRLPVRTNAERRAVAYGTAAPPMAQARAATVWHQQQHQQPQRQDSVATAASSDVDVRDHVVPEGYTVSPMSETFSPGLPGSYGKNLGAVHGRDGAF